VFHLPRGRLSESVPMVATPNPLSARLPALDWLRGFVMVLMTVDHASGELNAGRLMTDGTTLYTVGTVLPAAQFLTRWMTHLCAPTFVFLAGAALALSVERRKAAGESARDLDRFVVTRGLLIAALDPLWMSWVFIPGRVFLQVLYAIGGSLVAMAALRRLRTRWLVIVALALMFGGEALTGLALAGTGGVQTLPVALLLTGGRLGPVIVAYPLLPWLAIMMLGWVLGRHLLSAGPERSASLVARGALAALVLFVVVRGLNGYGNMLLLRDDASPIQWLHVSKYPPSLSYDALELGLMALFLAPLLRIGQPASARGLGPLLVLGQTALFFYLLHVHVLALGTWALDLGHRGGLAATYVGALATVLVLYPLCVWYRGYKRAHPDGWPRYI
jgi:uncharacterized membrane protein